MKDGGPAFPVPESANYAGYPGMTLREWYAGLAMQGLIARGWQDLADDESVIATMGPVYRYSVCHSAFIFADEMLAASEAT